jgi:hypothetical protein
MGLGDRFRAARMTQDFKAHVQVDPKQLAEHPQETMKAVALLERMFYLGALAGLEGRGFAERDQVIGNLALQANANGVPPEQIKQSCDNLEKAWMAGWTRGSMNVRGKA